MWVYIAYKNMNDIDRRAFIIGILVLSTHPGKIGLDVSLFVL